MTTSAAYVLGDGNAEHARLERQAGALQDLTRTLLTAAGVSPGMRVLDIGCGMGDVSLLASELVGPAGRVTGIDRDTAALAKAKARAEAAGAANVTFLAGDIVGSDLPRGFDAIVGRLVLMYVPDASALLRELKAKVVHGGVMAFHEIVLPYARSVPPVPCFEDAIAKMCETFAGAGANPTMGLSLDRAFRDAGLLPLSTGGVVMDGQGEGFCPAWVAQTAGSLLPAMVRLGVSTESDMDVATLEDRVRSGAREASSIILGPLMVGTWARVP